ncbi:hypothetical protein AAG570_008627 [Ranatra chinensis]|uniref:Uncharacterized protein n=1 Tax=Ranatra chinensis TaxID=642074 RepID=A0ABD0YRG5_9HEMI
MASKRRNMFHKNKTQETTEEVKLNNFLLRASLVQIKFVPGCSSELILLSSMLILMLSTYISTLFCGFAFAISWRMTFIAWQGVRLQVSSETLFLWVSTPLTPKKRTKRSTASMVDELPSL